MDDEKRREYCKEWKKRNRALNTPYATRQRELKRDESTKAKRREWRKSPEQRAKDAAYIREFRKRPE